MPVPGGIISRTTQLVRGLRNIDAFGFEHIQVGNNSAEIVRVLPLPRHHNLILVKQT